jgi:hypothetical protein
MAFTNIPYELRLSDLSVREINPTDATGHDNINVTPPAASAPLNLGQIVWRVKSTDPAAPYVVVDDATDLAAANEYAVIIGDQYGFNAKFVPNAVTAGRFNAVAYRRGPQQLKDLLIKQVHSNLVAADFAKLSELLKLQGIVLVKAV